ncbi:MAG: hypothetical protein ABIR81_02525 [Ginsengibacter sp.]
MGNTEEAFNFYKSIFGGEFTSRQRFSDTPEKDRIPVNEQHMLMHVALPIGVSILMGTDALESMRHKFLRALICQFQLMQIVKNRLTNFLKALV